MDRLILVRHAHTAHSARGLLNPDAALDVPLSDEGERAARELGRSLEAEPIDVVVSSPRLRARRTAELALAGRDVPLVVVDEFAEIGTGSFAGGPVDAYRTWMQTHSPGAAPPGGESLLDASARYAAGLRRVRALPQPVALVVLHNLPLRMTLNAAAGQHPTAGPFQRMSHAARADLTAGELHQAAVGIEAWAASWRAATG